MFAIMFSRFANTMAAAAVVAATRGLRRDANAEVESDPKAQNSNVPDTSQPVWDKLAQPARASAETQITGALSAHRHNALPIQMPTIALCTRIFISNPPKTGGSRQLRAVSFSRPTEQSLPREDLPKH